MPLNHCPGLSGRYRFIPNLEIEDGQAHIELKKKLCIQPGTMKGL
jgi:hypothetical protein